MKPFNYRFPVFCGISAAAGVVSSALLTRFSPFFPLILPLITAIAAISGFAVARSKTILVHAAVYIVLFCVCSLRISYIVKTNESAPEPTGEVYVSGVVDEVMTYSSAKNASFVRIGDLSSDEIDESGSAVAEVHGRPEVGDTVFVRGYVTKNDLGKVDVYNFPRGVSYSFNEVTESGTLSSGGGLFYVVRTGIKRILAENCSEKVYPFALALMIGETSDMDDLSYANMKAAGISHIFAVSGLHIGFIAALVSFLFELLNVRRLKNAVIVLVVTFLYSGVCGFPVSAIRATIICFVYGLARSFGEKPDPMNAVFSAMAIILILFPASLFSLGFMLSFAAVTGIALFRNSLLFAMRSIRGRAADALAVTVSAFIFTAPILVFVSGGISLVTVLMNFLFLPVVSALYYILIASVAMTAVIPMLSGVFAVANGLTSLIIDAFSLVAFKRFFLRGSITIPVAALYYGLIVLASEKINLPLKIRKAFACAAPFTLLLMI